LALASVRSTEFHLLYGFSDSGWPKPFFPRLWQIKHFNNSTTKRDEILHTFVKMFVELPAPNQHRHESHLAISGSICHNAYNFKSSPQVGPTEEAEGIHMQMQMRSKMLNTCQRNADDNANEIIFTTFTLSRACFAPALSTHNNINHHLPATASLLI